jgi:hypothetical protein
VKSCCWVAGGYYFTTADPINYTYPDLTLASLSGGFVPPVIQVGAILIDDWPLMIKLRALETEPFSGNWSLVKALDGLALDRKIRASGWNFFFMAAEVKAMSLGALGAKKIQNALKRILKEVKQQHFNSLEVTAIVAKRFLGVPYAIVSAHSRHVQESCYLENAKVRGTSQRDAEWARGGVGVRVRSEEWTYET